MHSYWAGVQNEISKLAARKKMILLPALLLLLPIAASILLSQLQSGIGIAAISSGDFPQLMLGVYTNFLLPLLIFMAAADMFAGEVQDRTLKITLMRPISRFQVFSSKITVLALFALIILAAALIVSLLAGLVLQARSGMGESVMQAIVSYMAAWFPMTALAIAAALLAQFFRSASGALAICVVLYVALKGLGILYPQLAAYSPTFYTDWHQLWINNGVSAGKLVNASTYLLACCILCFTAAFVMFDKRQL
ncbi:ABC-2 type transport system permease protein [Paenibacillus sp. 1_12]|uniref:ABC transporter permease n=1 Tax=Paenibacillus sp. 1_12 TaxID=1566278 RepID=UPI0008F0A7C0|nr:ABC transporter permease [Paenibacillus sp. 1_12]SFL31204.1 ABC-2 type transport system permease protein [Paenibacillus sp. 1_12]